LAIGSPPVPKGVPNCLKKRKLLNDQTLSPTLCQEYGLKFLALDWREDALEFFKKGGITEELEKLKAYSLETGDAFLLARLGERQPEVWRQLAERALTLDKWHFARRAFEMAGDDDKGAMVTGLIAGQTVGADQTPVEVPGEAPDEGADG
jgi:hypothetical protein